MAAAVLTHFQSLKSSCDRLVVAIEDVNDLWPIVKEGFEARVPFQKACLVNKARNPAMLDKLPVEYILTTDSRLRSRIPNEQNAFCFHEPYATVVLVTCEDLDEYKTILKPRLKLITQNDEREWFIVFVSKAQLANDQAGKLIKKVYGKVEVDFSSKKRERCCKLDMHVADAAFWEDVESKIVECIRITLERRIQFYEDEIRNLSEMRFSHSWNFCNFFVLKESLAFMFQMAQLDEDALREYDELEQSYTESVSVPTIKHRRFGGQDSGDDCAAILDPNRKALNEVIEDDTFQEFDFRQYIFARQAHLLFTLGRAVDVAARGFSFIISFSKILSEHEKNIPFCMREIWVITACLELLRATGKLFSTTFHAMEMEKEFCRLQADLYSLARVKLMRLADLIGYGKFIERSPCNSASLSMLPWPKPNVWPAIPDEVDSLIAVKEQGSYEKPKPFGIIRKALPLAPSLLLRDANRRRAALSVGNLPEIFESRLSFRESPSGDNGGSISSPSQVAAATPARSVSFGIVNSGTLSPGSGRIDRPMRLSEIYAAAEVAIQSGITNERLKRALSSVETFEEFYIELTKAAAEHYHRSWRKRHGVVLDGEIAAFHYRHGSYDSAAKLYEKVCAMYAGDGWHALLAEVLPNLAECQKQLGDLAGYLQSCIKLLSLERHLLREEERKTIQSEVLRLAHSELKKTVSVDVSSLITFSGKGGSPLKLCEGDPGNLSISVWSGFPCELSLDALSVTLIAAFTPEEGVKVIKSADGPCLKPGKNNVLMVLPPQRPGSYVLGVLTGRLGQMTLRSHTYCMTSALSSKGGSPESDDYLSSERPLRPVLQVSEPRSLLEITSVVSWGLLMNELQWLGLIIRPIDYSLKGSILNIKPEPGLQIDDPQFCELEMAEKLLKRGAQQNSYREATCVGKDIESLELRSGRVSLPEWVSEQASVLWLRVKAYHDKSRDGLNSPSSPSSPANRLSSQHLNGQMMNDSLPHENLSIEQGRKKHRAAQKDGQVAGVRKLGLKLEYGASCSRLYEKTLTIQFLDPLLIASRVVARGNDSTLLLQITLISQLNAKITIEDARLDLQTGFSHVGSVDGVPYPASILPLVMAPSTESALMYTISVEDSSKENGNATALGESSNKSILTIKYRIKGNRTLGAHSPSSCSTAVVDSDRDTTLQFKSFLTLQRPILDPLLAIGMLSLPISNLFVGEQILIQWRIERIKEALFNVVDEASANYQVDVEELFYEVEVDPDCWMLAGRKKGFFSLAKNSGGRAVISLTCIPLQAGYVRPPTLILPFIDRTRISNTPGPHSICVLPPVLCSSFCVKKG